MSTARARRRAARLVTLAVSAAVFLAVSLAVPAMPASSSPDGPAPDVSVRWNRAFLEAVKQTALGPPAVARGLAILNTCMYNAWAAYDDRAVGTEPFLRRPAGERTEAWQAPAVSQAAFLAATDVLPSERPRFEALMADLGLDPGRASRGPDTPGGVGRAACEAVLRARHGDGANQLGDVPGSSGRPYSDYTGYQPANPAGRLLDASRWQPLGPQKFLAPHWGRVAPFALPKGSQLRSPTGPARYPSRQYSEQAQEAARLNAALNDETKAIAEYWADGPGTATPPGHWVEIAVFCAERDGMSLGENVKMFFALGNALLDASIAAWDSKVAFDSVRPVTAVRFLNKGRAMQAWAGPGQGTRIIDAAGWRPYLATPPFAEYPSGHSTFSAAAAEVLRSITHGDNFGLSVKVAAGSSAVEPGLTPARDVTLFWSSFTEAAVQAGYSRRLGGIHFEQADLDGRALGTATGALVWAKAQRLFAGLS